MYCDKLNRLSIELTQLSSGIAVVFAAEKDFDYGALQVVLKETKITVVGAFFPGVIAEGQVRHSGFVLKHFDSSFDLQLCDLNNVDIEFPRNNIFTGTGIVLMDALSECNQAFLNTVLYECGKDFKFIGAGAGSLDLIHKPCVFDKDGIYADKAIMLFLQQKVAIGVKHGYTRMAGPFVATRTEGKKIVELNWENPYEVYSNIVNKDSSTPISKEDFLSVSKCYPLGLGRKGHEDIVRDPISVDSDGSIHCIDAVPENAALYVLKGEKTKLIEAASISCLEALNQLTDEHEPSHCLIIDCVSRELFLGDDFDKEVKIVCDTLATRFKNIQIEGVLSMGEVSTFKNGRLEIYNKTVLTTMLHV
ncbi:MAG: hypothetical protein ACI9M3_000758 [Bacteroidia bacterium]|jgi:hypothetical protein